MAEPTPELPQGIKFEWDNDARPAYQFSDFMSWRVGMDRCYLTFGHMDLPTQEAPFADGSVLPIRHVVRLAVTPDTLKIWAGLLNNAVAALNKAGEPK